MKEHVAEEPGHIWRHRGSFLEAKTATSLDGKGKGNKASKPSLKQPTDVSSLL